MFLPSNFYDVKSSYELKMAANTSSDLGSSILDELHLCCTMCERMASSLSSQASLDANIRKISGDKIV